MSSDYRPRGGRRRRGGRNRPGGSRPYDNKASSTPKKSSNPIANFFSWLFGKKKTASTANKFNNPGNRPVAKDNRPKREDRPERLDRQDRPKSEPVLHEITSPKLYVGNLAYETSESDLFDLFSKVGAVKNVEIAMDRHSNRSKGFGFVEMESLETAKEASAKYNRTDFLGRQIVVSGAKTDKRLSEVRGSSPVTEESAL